MKTIQSTVDNRHTWQKSPQSQLVKYCSEQTDLCIDPKNQWATVIVDGNNISHRLTEIFYPPTLMADCTKSSVKNVFTTFRPFKPQMKHWLNFLQWFTTCRVVKSSSISEKKKKKNRIMTGTVISKFWTLWRVTALYKWKDTKKTQAFAVKSWGHVLLYRQHALSISLLLNHKSVCTAWSVQGQQRQWKMKAWHSVNEWKCQHNQA